jgi:hypothetical protein
MTKLLFYIGMSLLVIFEIANVFFIMPMPGSQEVNSLDLAYFLHSWRWGFRLSLGVIVILSFFLSKWKKLWAPMLMVVVWALVTYMCNFKMAAEVMFYQPSTVLTNPIQNNLVDSNRLVIGVEHNGFAKAYPIQYIGYHHQVLDSLGETPIMVTYCTVCRTGRIYEPKVNGQYETFRLVGMDHYNAMFEDSRTGSWWQQATGKAVTGKLKGEILPELRSNQMRLAEWLELYPHSEIMQADPKFQEKYDSMSVYETVGKSKLTKTDTSSWNKKSWVVGVKIDGKTKAYDWNQLKSDRSINDQIGATPIFIVLLDDQTSFMAFERPSALDSFTIENNILSNGDIKYNLKGELLSENSEIKQLKPIHAYQEFWHSWKTFNEDL